MQNNEIKHIRSQLVWFYDKITREWYYLGSTVDITEER